MREKQWGEEYRTAVICIDRFEKGTLSGRLRHPALDGAEAFSGVLELLRKMEAVLDGLEFPQSFTARRSFRPAEAQAAAGSGGASSLRRGALATFSVRVQFRRNASWQGSVSWLEGDRKENFRSVLELLLLIDSALATN